MSLPASLLFLPQMGCIRAYGPDARRFLQGQLTNDAHSISPERGQLSGYCSVKGRLLAVLIVVQSGPEQFDLLLPSTLLASTLKRLKMFVLRSQLQLSDVGPQLHCLGVLGGSVGHLAATPFTEESAPEWRVSGFDGGWCLRLPGLPQRWIIAGSPESLSAWSAKAALPPCSWNDWLAADVATGLPQVWPETVDAFVPQTIDLDLAQGLSFKKGCYPGQEIVARVHYLGRLKARLHRAELLEPALVKVGQPVLLETGDGQAVGSVVTVASTAQASTLLLSLQLSCTESTQLRLGASDGPRLSAAKPVHPAAAA